MIRAVLTDMPTYEFRRVQAILCRKAQASWGALPNHKRVYHVMNVHSVPLQRRDGRVAVDHSNPRCCSDGFEISCHNGERVRDTFALDCRDRQSIGFITTTASIEEEDIRDLMLLAVAARFGRVNRLPQTIGWLTDNGSGYIVGETRRIASNR